VLCSWWRSEGDGGELFKFTDLDDDDVWDENGATMIGSDNLPGLISRDKGTGILRDLEM
jgi:hypothetical protein